jgi:hypothetical protein
MCHCARFIRFLHNLLNILVQIANKEGLKMGVCICCRENVFAESLPSDDRKNKLYRLLANKRCEGSERNRLIGLGVTMY